MTVRYDPDFIEKLKKVKVSIRKSFKERILLFIKNPENPQLHNHPLREDWKGYRSIDITNDWRAVYAEKQEGDTPIAYFVALGTHRELYLNK